MLPTAEIGSPGTELTVIFAIGQSESSAATCGFLILQPPEKRESVRLAGPDIDRQLGSEPSMTDTTALSRMRTTALATWATTERLVRGLSLSRIQAVVATLAGVVSVVGAVWSVVDFVRGGSTGELVAVVQAAGSHRSVPDATVEILTAQDALVATLTPDATGRATQELKEGVYVVRVSHPRYAVEARRIQVTPQHTTEVRANLRAGSSSPVSRGLSSIRKALRF